jgi:hypothetical protein
VLDLALAERGPKDILGDAKQPRQGRAVDLVPETAAAGPRLGEDLGGQVGGVVPDPGGRPGQDLGDVTVIDLSEGICLVQSQQIRVGAVLRE